MRCGAARWGGVGVCFLQALGHLFILFRFYTPRKQRGVLGSGARAPLHPGAVRGGAAHRLADRPLRTLRRTGETPPPPHTHTHTIPRRVRLWGPDTRAMVQPVSGARAAAAASIRGREYRRAWPQCVSRAEGVAAVAEVTRFASLITVIRDEIRVPDYGVTRFAVTGFASLITGGLEER